MAQRPQQQYGSSIVAHSRSTLSFYSNSKACKQHFMMIYIYIIRFSIIFFCIVFVLVFTHKVRLLPEALRFRNVVWQPSTWGLWFRSLIFDFRLSFVGVCFRVHAQSALNSVSKVISHCCSATVDLSPSISLD